MEDTILNSEIKSKLLTNWTTLVLFQGTDNLPEGGQSDTSGHMETITNILKNTQ